MHLVQLQGSDAEWQRRHDDDHVHLSNVGDDDAARTCGLSDRTSSILIKRFPCRPALPAAAIMCSTSAGVRCSRLRRVRFVTLRGGVTFSFSMHGELRLVLLNARTVLIENLFLSH